MSKELVISSNRHETKVAILEDDQLVEIYFQRSNEYSLAGSIHKGRVTRVLPGMQSAFVDLGLERDTFLYVSDFFEESEEYERIPAGREERPRRIERAPIEPAAETPDDIVEPRLTDPQAIDQHLSDPHATDPHPTDPHSTDRHLTEPRPGAPSGPSGLQSPPETPETLAPPPSGPRHEDDKRDQRGRRSRRRRNRGRGFPDSKYASDAGAPRIAEERPRVPEARVAEPQVLEARDPEPEPAEHHEFSVLPGESLAKYRRPQPRSSVEEFAGEEHRGTPTETAQLEPQPQAESEPRREPVPEPEPAPEHFSVGGAAPAREPEPEAPAIQAQAPAIEPEPEDEPEAAVDPDEALEAEAASEIIAEEREGGAFSPEEVVDSPQPALEMISADLARESTGPETGEPEQNRGAAETTEHAESKREATSGQLTANVREQGGRYMHRMPRRLRRKMRSDTRGGHDARTGPEPRGDAVAVAGGMAAPQPSVRPESQPTFVGPDTRPDTRPEKAATPSITDLLKEGQEILVQIAKEPLGQKGARITSHIALPGRYVVYMPTLEHMGVSRKIASDDERLRLKRILQTHTAGMTGGFIVRTAGEGKPEDDIASDMGFLYNLWLDIRQKAEKRPAPLLLHHDLDIVERTLRDQLTDSFKAIWLDNEELYESVLRFVQRFQPALVGRVKLYTRSAPIFDAFNITPELEKALRPKVWLKSGGYIVINQTEALVAIDVNTGKYVGKSNRLEDTIVKTNTEAIKEIVRQIRLRDLGGIIVVDFIDMDERKNRQKVMQTLEETMRADKAPYKILQFNDFGLVAITRKRVKQSLERALCMPCPYCEGAGYVKSVQTTVGDILQEAHKIAAAIEGKDVILRVHPEVAKHLKSNQNRYLEELEEILRRPVLVKADPALQHDKFDLA
jgi:ribonuclease G